LAWVAVCYLKDTCAFLKLACVNPLGDSQVCIYLDVNSVRTELLHRIPIITCSFPYGFDLSAPVELNK